jgi:hypothetical protein
LALTVQEAKRQVAARAPADADLSQIPETHLAFRSMDVEHGEDNDRILRQARMYEGTSFVPAWMPYFLAA